MTYSKKLLWQKGPFAQYAEIDLDVSATQGEGFRLEMPADVAPHWAIAIAFAAELFTELFSWKHPAAGNLVVRIKELRAVPCDTTLMSLAFVTFHAMCSAVDIDGGRIFTFDTTDGDYHLNLSANRTS